MMGSHNMVTERVSITIKGESDEGKNKQGVWGEGKEIMATKRFLVTIGMWQLKGFWSP
jgi:hypothetical protein